MSKYTTEVHHQFSQYHEARYALSHLLLLLTLVLAIVNVSQEKTLYLKYILYIILLQHFKNNYKFPIATGILVWKCILLQVNTFWGDSIDIKLHINHVMHADENNMGGRYNLVLKVNFGSQLIRCSKSVNGLICFREVTAKNIDRHTAHTIVSWHNHK